MQHDGQFDYYGTRVATCSSDGGVRVFEVREDRAVSLLAELRGFAYSFLSSCLLPPSSFLPRACYARSIAAFVASLPRCLAIT